MVTASHFIKVKGARIHYLECGSGDPIVFLHGIPTSSHIWEKVMPHVAALGRCIAPDLIGIGLSDKPKIAYTIADHIEYFSQFIKALDLKNITFVVHDWGSLIGLSYAMQHSKNCRALVFYEAFLRPFDELDFSLPFLEQISWLQKQNKVLSVEKNTDQIVKTMLAQASLEFFSKADLAIYQKSFAAGNTQVLQQFINELPGGKDQEKANKIIADYTQALLESKLPKLLLFSLPGFVSSMAMVEWAKLKLPHLEVMEISEAMHYAQNVEPAIIGEAISVWLQSIEAISQ